MEEVIKKITQILDQFAQEEYGNRLSQFAMLSLKSMILSELKKLEKDEEVK
jgi:hypothetical protein